ncbi:MAG: GAF domain-containing protein [Actinomycetota bacterium]|nr:GAF domain-containing protein [Actinomycetota bacterium]
MSAPAQPELTGTIRIDPGIVTVTVVGEIDVTSVPLLRSLLDQAAVPGLPTVAIDLDGVTFCDAHGLGVLVSSENALHQRGSELIVRAAPTRLRQLFAMAGLTYLFDGDRPETDAHLGHALGQAANLPLTRTVLDAALQLVVTMAQAVVARADGVSITLPRNGQLTTVASSNDVVLDMDHDQYDTGEGPCLEAATHGERFHIDSMRDEIRWPAFVPRARARGIESILSTPLVTGSQPIGALNVYSTKVGAFAAHEKEWTDQFAAEAAAVVRSADPTFSAPILNAQITEALAARHVIALAQGVLMERESLDPEGAHAKLLAMSRDTSRPMQDVARGVLPKLTP